MSHIGSDEFVALTVDVDDFNRWVVFEVLTQFGDVHVHRASVEVVVVDPDGLERIVAFKNGIDMSAKQTQQLRLFGGKFGHFVFNHQGLLLSIEGESTDFVHSHFFAFLAFDTTQNGFNTKH